MEKNRPTKTGTAMKPSWRWAALALAMTELAIPAALATAPENGRIVLDQARALRKTVRAIEGRYRGLGPFQLQVEQRLRSATFGAQESQRGVLHVVPPNRLVLDFDEPAGDWAVFDGEGWWWAVTEDRMITHHLRREGEINLLIDLLSAQLDLMSLFAAGPDAAPVGVEGRARLQLLPRLARDDIERVVLEYEEESYTLRRIEITDPLGGQLIWVLSRPKSETSPPESRFAVEVPEGWFLSEE